MTANSFHRFRACAGAFALDNAHRVSVAITVGAAMAASSSASAEQVEELMSFQARLTDNLGNPLADGAHTLDFFVYDAATGGAIVGVVLDVIVQTSGGSGIVSTSIGPMEKGWFDDAPRFLGLTIDDNDDDPAGDELSPRIRLTSVPFALRAFSLQPSAIVNVQGGSFAGDVTVGGAIGIGTTVPGEQLHLKSISNNGIRLETTGTHTTPAYQIRNDAREWQMRVVGTDGDKFDIRDATASTSRFSIDAAGDISIGGAVAIGLASPYKKLHVLDTKSAPSADTMFWNWTYGGGLFLENRATATNAVTGIGLAGGASDHSLAGIGMVQEVADSLGGLAFYTGGAGRGNTVPERLRIDSAGNVGIGTTAPTKQLQVNGDLRFEGGLRSIVTNDHGDGVDNEYLSLSGGAIASFNRGAYIRVHGNEVLGDGGHINYQLGKVAGAQHRFFTHDGAVNALSMVVDTGGNVGIGTTTPGAKLTVAGIIQSTSGGIMFPDGTVQSTMTLQGPIGQTGPQGLQGLQGVPGPPGPAVSTSSLCAAYGSCPSNPTGCFVLCGGQEHVVAMSCGPCTVTSNTGSCSGASGGWICCVCKP